jgi:prolipoprotein diacylglyceryl transferase
MNPAYITWNASPIMFRLGGFEMQWYGLLFLMGFVFCYYVMSHIFKKEQQKMRLLDILTLFIFIGTVLGARLGHVFFYEWSYYKVHLSEIPKIWEGGLASHGATLGIVIATILFCLIYKVRFLWLLDRLAIVVPLAAACIRLGNLFNSEIYGTVTTLPWGFVFVNDPEAGLLPRHPTQIYEIITHLITFVILFLLWKKQPLRDRHGFYTGLLLMIIFTTRFLIEFIKTNQVDFEKTMSLNLGQWLSIPFILGGAALIIISHLLEQKKKPQETP